MPLLSPEEIEEILSSGLLYDWNSIFIINPITKHYTTDLPNQGHLERAKSIRDQFLAGSSIVIQNLERYSHKLRSYSLKFSPETSVHMYLTPPGGSPSFDFHTDDCDVDVLMVIGEKKFEIKNEDGTVKTVILKEGQELSLAQGVLHRASTTQATCLLSFGHTAYTDYKVLPAVSASDFR